MGAYTDDHGQYRQTETAMLRLPLNNFWLAAGTPLAAFADGASPTPGLALDNSEAAGIRWNNHATPSAIWTQVAMPNDRRPYTGMTLKILASKSGATVGDAVTFTVTAFNQANGALHDADADFGGASSAMDGDATAKTVQLCTLALGQADLADAPANTSISIKPTDGLLGTDDVTIHAAWLEYERVITPAV